jgi:hypothetical protein
LLLVAVALIQFDFADIVKRSMEAVVSRLLLLEPGIASQMLLGGEVVSLACARAYLVLLDHSALIGQGIMRPIVLGLLFLQVGVA